MGTCSTVSAPVRPHPEPLCASVLPLCSQEADGERVDQAEHRTKKSLLQNQKANELYPGVRVSTCNKQPSVGADPIGADSDWEKSVTLIHTS